MIRLGLDTNVVLRYLLNDDKKQAAIAARIIEDTCGEGTIGYINFAVFIEVCWVLLESKKIKLDKVRFVTAIDRLLTYKNLQFEHVDVIRQALYEIGKVNSDIGDILIGFVNMKKQCITTLTFDKAAYTKLEEFTNITSYT